MFATEGGEETRHATGQIKRGSYTHFRSDPIELPPGATSTGKRNSRNFYGVLKVVESDENDPDRHKLRLKHGSTDHGLQFVADDKRRMPESQVNPKPAKCPWLPADSTKPLYR